jgi:hypothetical protein
VVSQASAVLLVETVRKTASLDQAITAALAPWCKPRAVHDPGKILALATALGGDCLADVAMLRAEPEVFGPVASDPTVSRLIDTLAAAGTRALAAIRAIAASVLPSSPAPSGVHTASLPGTTGARRPLRAREWTGC